MSSPRTWTRIPLLAAAAVLVTACSSAAPSPGVVAPSILDPWVHTMGAGLPGAGYLTITGGSTDDALVAASSPIAGEVQIHETTSDGSGMMGMQSVEQIDIPAGGTVALEPGGYHLMLMELSEAPAVGETVELTLTFQRAGDVVVEAEVRAG